MITNPNNASDRPPTYLTSEERKRYQELADNYRIVAGRKTGVEAATAYEKSAQNYELVRNHELAHKMRQLSNALRSRNPRITNNSMAASVISVGVLGALAFFYSGISGNIVADSGNDTMNWLGVGLLLFAIIFGIVYLLKKRK